MTRSNAGSAEGDKLQGNGVVNSIIDVNYFKSNYYSQKKMILTSIVGTTLIL